MHTIRQATITDLPTLRHFWTLAVLSETYPEDQAEDVDMATRQLATMLAAEDPPGFAFLAEEDVEGVPLPLGMLIYQIHYRSIGQPSRFAFCSHLYVLPDHRRRAIAADLIEVAATHGLSRGITTVELNAAPGDPFHDGLGHTLVALRMRTTCARLLASVDQHRERRQRANGHDQDVALTAPVAPTQEEQEVKP